MKREKLKPPCPVCNKRDEVVEIVYGMPTHEAFEKAQRGLFRLGGCVLEAHAPNYYCKRDDVEFRYQPPSCIE